MLNFCPLCVAEVYALRCDAMRAGTSHYPLHRPATTYCLCCISYAVFLYLQNLYLSTSKRCIKMGIPSLNSAILYIISLYFNLSSREISRHHANITNIPNLGHKTALFLDGMLIFPFPSRESGIFMHREMKFGIGTFMHQVLFNELNYLSLIMKSSWNFIY